MPPGLVLDKFDLNFSATGLLILGPTVFLVFLFAGAVDGIVVLDESVAGDGREAIVPRVGTRTLILSRRGCDGIRHVVMEDEKGKSHKASKDGCRTRGRSEKGRQKNESGKIVGLSAVSWQNGWREERRRDGEGRNGRGTGRGREDDGMAWASFLERETVPCWETTTKLGEKRTGDLYK